MKITELIDIVSSNADGRLMNGNSLYFFATDLSFENFSEHSLSLKGDLINKYNEVTTFDIIKLINNPELLYFRKPKSTESAELTDD